MKKEAIKGNSLSISHVLPCLRPGNPNPKQRIEQCKQMPTQNISTQLGGNISQSTWFDGMITQKMVLLPRLQHLLKQSNKIHSNFTFK
ncbi:hypothetical protein ACTXT7_004281 [Hymenolepis weldensis]